MVTAIIKTLLSIAQDGGGWGERHDGDLVLHYGHKCHRVTAQEIADAANEGTWTRVIDRVARWFALEKSEGLVVGIAGKPRSRFRTA